MITGGCPYDDCDEPMMVGIPDRPLPVVAPHDCEGCGRVIWTYFSRLDPWSMTDEDFRSEYEVDDEAREIRKRA